MKTIFAPESVSKNGSQAPAATTERAVKSAAKKTASPKRIQPVSERFPAQEKQEVFLKFVAPEAKKVEVAGTFNGWRPAYTPLRHTEAGEWSVRLMLPAGEYEYRFVVDGNWIDDPQAERRVANPYGGFNSVVKVALDVTTEFL